MLLDGFVCLCFVDPDEIVLNLLVGPAEQPSQVLLEAEHFAGIALDESSGDDHFLLIDVAVGIIEGVLTFAEVNGVIGKEELDLAVARLLDDRASLLEARTHPHL